MKINPIVVPGVYKTYELTVPKEISNVQNTQRDEVELSGEAKSFASVISAVKNQISERSMEETQRIADVGKAVQSGEYSIDSQDIANRILGTVDLKA